MSARRRSTRLHAVAAFLIIATDWLLVANAYWYPIRLLAALVLGLLVLPLIGSNHAIPGPGNVREACKHTLNVIFTVSLFGIILFGVAVWIVRAWDLRFATAPQNIRAYEDIPFFLLHAVLWAPIVEELIYRGLLLPRLVDWLSRVPAIIVCGLAFWVLHWVPGWHMSPWNHLFAGLLLSWSQLRTKGLLAPILLHAAGNLLVLACDVILIAFPTLPGRVFGWS